MDVDQTRMSSSEFFCRLINFIWYYTLKFVLLMEPETHLEQDIQSLLLVDYLQRSEF